MAGKTYYIRAMLDTGRKQLIGMVHLQPLPGAPRYAGSMHAVLESAVRDAGVLQEAGFDALMIENFGDTPFAAESVAPETIAAMAVAAAAVRSNAELPVGVNVLRNDAAAALGIAAAVGAAFIRVNVHTGAMLTDQGWVTGKAYETLRLRQALQPDCLIAADVLVKHAVALPGTDIGAVASDTYERGHADVLIVSGRATGAATDPERVAQVKRAVPRAPVWIGSGVTIETAASLLAVADGAIIGSALKMNGDVNSPVDRALARSLVARIRAL